MKKLLVSFSGGETSAFMAQWLIKHKSDEFEMVFVFANTGLENEETLRFVHKFDNEFNLNVVWIEALVYHGERKGTGFKITNFVNAARDGQPFEEIIIKYGIPNNSFPHCTRELKTSPIHSYAKSLGWKDYYTAIGIREDEIDRIDSKRKEKRFIYPLAEKEMQPMTKPKINFWWSQQTFRLELRGYQGNCITCWKKSDSKLFQIAKENDRNFIFMDRMEAKYGKFIPESRLLIMKNKNILPVFPITFFRKNRSAIQIIEESKKFNGQIIDDSQQNESCEVHTECDPDFNN